LFFFLQFVLVFMFVARLSISCWNYSVYCMKRLLIYLLYLIFTCLFAKYLMIFLFSLLISACKYIIYIHACIYIHICTCKIYICRVLQYNIVILQWHTMACLLIFQKLISKIAIRSKIAITFYSNHFGRNN